MSSGGLQNLRKGIKRHACALAGPMAVGALLLGGCSGEDGRWYSEAQVEQGARVFAEHCAQCHGLNAEATPHWRTANPDGTYPPPPLDGTAHAWHHSLDVLRRQIRIGGIPLGGVMPPFAETLGAAEIDAAIAYFQSKWSDEIYAIWEERNAG
jgi:mono/diheme cytochrome c family protein